MNKENIYDKLKPDIYKKIEKILKGNKNILEIGCGNCKLVNFLAKYTSSKIIGIDISGKNFKKANKQAIKLGITNLVEYKKMDASHLDGFKDSIFNAVVMVYVLHGLDKPALALKEIYRVLKNKGKILIVDFPRESEAEKIWKEKYFLPEKVKSILTQTKFNKIGIDFPYGRNFLMFASGQKN